MRILILLIIWLLSDKACCQKLSTGQKVPNLVLNSVINYGKEKLSLDAFDGKAIFIDFFTTGCTACLHAFPKLESLQKKFSEEIQIILVTPQRKSQVVEFFKRRPHLKPYLPIITEDTILAQMFPRSINPYVVWIDMDSKLQCISYGESLSERNVMEFLSGNENQIEQVPEDEADFYSTAMNEAVLPSVKQYSYIANWTSLYKSERYFGTKDSNRIILRTQGTVSELYEQAYTDLLKNDLNPSNFILEIPSQFLKPTSSQDQNSWRQKSYFVYELSIPEDKKSKAYQYMREDLMRYFDFTITKEKRLMHSIVLKRSDSIDHLASKGGHPKNTFHESNAIQLFTDSIRILVNQPFKVLTQKVKGYLIHTRKIPFLDETNYKGNVDVTLAMKCIDPFNYDEFKSGLLTYGLQFVEEERMIDVFVLRKKPELSIR